MLPYLHKYITASPSTSSVRSSKKRKKRGSSSSSSKHRSKIKKIGDSHNEQHCQRSTKPSITASSDTFHSHSQYPLQHKPSFNSNISSSNISSSNNEHKYNELPSTSESKVIFIETINDTDSDSIPSKSSKSLFKLSNNNNDKKKKSKKHNQKAMRYWTVSIASKHNDIYDDSEENKTKKKEKITMGFGICDISKSINDNEIILTENEEIDDNEYENKNENNKYDDHGLYDFDLNTNSLLKSSNYGYGYCVTYSDNHKYQSYHTKLKCLDDILISFNIKTNKLTLWQNGKRFNRIFQLQSDKIYGFGIKLYGDDYSIKIMPNTGN